jgi:hypothetical protein
VDLCPEAEIHFCRYFEDNESENDVGATSIGPPKRNAALHLRTQMQIINQDHVGIQRIDAVNEKTCFIHVHSQ